MKKYLLILSLLTATTTFAMPSRIVLIRHGEEPTKGDEGRHLSKTGWKRAYALPTLFTSHSEFGNRPLPDFLVATKPHKSKGAVRAIQTLEPLAKKLGKEILALHTRDEIPEMIQYLAHDNSFNNKTVLIAWQHDTLSELAHGLGAVEAPKHWPGKDFDRLWILDFKNGQLVKFKDVPQRLLKEDSKY